MTKEVEYISTSVITHSFLRQRNKEYESYFSWHLPCSALKVGAYSPSLSWYFHEHLAHIEYSNREYSNIICLCKLKESGLLNVPEVHY